MEQWLVAALASLGIGSGIVATVRVLLPWARRLVPAVVTISGALEASRDRLIASLREENTELTRLLAGCRERLAGSEGEAP